MQWLSPSPVCHSPSLHVLVWTSFWTGVIVFCSLFFFFPSASFTVLQEWYSLQTTRFTIPELLFLTFPFSFLLTKKEERKIYVWCCLTFSFFISFLQKRRKKMCGIVSKVESWLADCIKRIMHGIEIWFWTSKDYSIILFF